MVYSYHFLSLMSLTNRVLAFFQESLYPRMTFHLNLNFCIVADNSIPKIGVGSNNSDQMSRVWPICDCTGSC